MEAKVEILYENKGRKTLNFFLFLQLFHCILKCNMYIEKVVIIIEGAAVVWLR